MRGAAESVPDGRAVQVDPTQVDPGFRAPSFSTLSKHVMRRFRALRSISTCVTKGRIRTTGPPPPCCWTLRAIPATRSWTTSTQGLCMNSVPFSAQHVLCCPSNRRQLSSNTCGKSSCQGGETLLRLCSRCTRLPSCPVKLGLEVITSQCPSDRPCMEEMGGAIDLLVMGSRGLKAGQIIEFVDK
jgi:hypothetical protein